MTETTVLKLKQYPTTNEEMYLRVAYDNIIIDVWYDINIFEDIDETILYEIIKKTRNITKGGDDFAIDNFEISIGTYKFFVQYYIDGDDYSDFDLSIDQLFIIADDFYINPN